MKVEEVTMPRYPRAYYVAAGICLYLAFLIATAPASMMDWMLQRLTHHRVSLVQPEGGFWHGKAQNVLLRDDAGETEYLGAPNWAFLFLPLFKGEVAAKVEVGEGANMSRCIVAAGIGKLHLRELKAIIPVIRLSDFSPMWKTWKIGGDLRFSSDDFSFTRQGARGKAMLEWRNASVGLSPINPLGTYRVDMQGEGNAVKIGLSTISGVLHLAGTGDWSKTEGLNFRGTANSEPSSLSELRDMLRVFGKEQGNGVYSITITHQHLYK